MSKARRTSLLAFCRSLPLITEDVKWGNDLVFSVGGKMFAGFAKDGKDATFGCKVPEHDFAAITSVDGIRPAPYAARFYWVSVDDPDVLPESEALALLRGSYDLVKDKLPLKVQRAIEAAGGTKRGGAVAKEASAKKATAKKATAKKATAKKAGAKKAGAKKATAKKANAKGARG